VDHRLFEDGLSPILIWSMWAANRHHHPSLSSSREQVLTGGGSDRVPEVAPPLVTAFDIARARGGMTGAP